MPTLQEIAADIYLRARQRGINPNLALGIAAREGLTPGTINSPTYGNPDVHGYSYGQWQLYSGSPTPGAVAPGGQAAQFQARYGARPSAANWREQNQFAIDLLARLNPQQQAATWHAIGDAGGHDRIAAIGQQMAAKYGVADIQGNPAPLGGGAAPQVAGGDASFELGPPPNDTLPQPDTEMAQADLTAPGAGGMYGGDDGGDLYGGGMDAAPLEDLVSNKYAATQSYRRMGVKDKPTEMNLSDVFQPQNVALQKIGAARQMQQTPRKMSVG